MSNPVAFVHQSPKGESVSRKTRTWASSHNAPSVLCRRKYEYLRALFVPGCFLVVLVGQGRQCLLPHCQDQKLLQTYSHYFWLRTLDRLRADSFEQSCMVLWPVFVDNRQGPLLNRRLGEGWIFRPKQAECCVICAAPRTLCTVT